MSLLISGATVIDGVAERPIEGMAVLIEDRRIKAIRKLGEINAPAGAKVLDARGKYLIPGLMNANVHLLIDLRLENLVRHERRYEELVIEAAQVSLKNGVTTVFDTNGPRKPLIAARERINAGQAAGSRIYCAGWIVGMDGPLSEDFYAHGARAASADLAARINSLCVENVGPDLMWMTPDQVRSEVRHYIGRGIDFLKFAANDHLAAYTTFSERVQTTLVEEAHRAGITAQAHIHTVEGLRVAIEVGCDLVQHVNITGPVPIPEATFELMVARKTGAVVFPFTQRRLEMIMKGGALTRRNFASIDVNCRNLIKSGASILLATDGGIFAPDAATEPLMSGSWAAPGEDNIVDLASGHFAWLKAMEEKGMGSMEMLRAATRNIAVAYGKDKDLGTLEPGKVADIVVLDENPLDAAENYRSIDTVIKDGVAVDRNALPMKPILTAALSPLPEETQVYGRYSLGRFARHLS